MIHFKFFFSRNKVSKLLKGNQVFFQRYIVSIFFALGILLVLNKFHRIGSLYKLLKEKLCRLSFAGPSYFSQKILLLGIILLYELFLSVFRFMWNASLTPCTPSFPQDFDRRVHAVLLQHFDSLFCQSILKQICFFNYDITVPSIPLVTGPEGTNPSRLGSEVRTQRLRPVPRPTPCLDKG